MSVSPPPPPGGTPFPPPPPPTTTTSRDGGWPIPPAVGGNVVAGPGSSGYSPWGRRAAAALLRGVSVMPAYLPVGIGLFVGAQIHDVVGLLLGLAGLVYFVAVGVRFYLQRGHLGTDVGDAAVGQRLVREATGAPMGSGWSVFGRNILGAVNSVLLYLGWLWPLWDAKRQTFADKILSTVVVRCESPHGAGALFRNAYEVWKPVLRS